MVSFGATYSNGALGGVDGYVLPPSEAHTLRRSAGLCSSVSSLRANKPEAPHVRCVVCSR